MDFITPIFNLLKWLWPYIKKFIPYIIIAAMCLLIWILWGRLRHFQSESERHKHNTSELFHVANYMAQDIELNRAEIRKIGALDSTLKSLNLRPKHVKEFHEIKAETTIIERVRIDTVNGSGYIPLNYGCVSGGVTLQGDSADIDLKNDLDLIIVTSLERPKNWFWNGKWNPKKWPINTAVHNKCDSNMTWELNRRVRVK